MSQSSPEERGKRRTFVGVVTSDKMAKTILVRVDRIVQHPVFKKYVRRRTRCMAHDENNDAKVGDRVEIVEVRPLSKNKSFRLVRVIDRARIPGAPVIVSEPGV